METVFATMRQPTAANTFHVPVAQGIERLPSKQRVAGSNPAWDATTATNWLNLSLKSRLTRAAFSLPKPLSDTLPYPVFRSYLQLLAYRTVFTNGGK